MFNKEEINIAETIKNKRYLINQINEMHGCIPLNVFKVFNILVNNLPAVDSRNAINMVLREYELPTIKSLAQVEEEIQKEKDEIELYKKLKIKYRGTEYDN